jgi:L-asparagine transporter-like permease
MLPHLPNTWPWLDILGLFLHLAGFVVGLGAVTVIDLHGFLGRKSAYWTEATTRTHKVTKPLIWLGLSLAVIGGAIFHRGQGWTSIVQIQAIIALILIGNGIFLSFRVSPYMLRREKEGRSGEILPTSWQQKITVAFIVSFLGWWSCLLLTVIDIIIYQ